MWETIKKLSIGLWVLAVKIVPKILSILVKSFKFGKVGLVGASVAAYSYLFTWQFACVIILALFVHEYGHIWAMKKCGLKVKGIYFIPFLGAAAVSDELFKTRREEAFIALMGPIWGYTLALLITLIYYVTNNTFFAAVAGWMCMVNLFNLLPVVPLDGGRVMKSIISSINSKLGLIFLFISLISAIILSIKLNLIIFAILAIVSGMEIGFEYRSYFKLRKELLIIRNEYILRGDNFVANKIQDKINHLAIPIMTKRQIAWSVFSYFTILLVLFGLMINMENIPEVDIATKLLVG